MTEDQLTPTGTPEEVPAEKPETTEVVAEPSVAPSSEAAVSETPSGEVATAAEAVADAPSQPPVSSPSGKTEDEMLFEAALAEFGSDDQGRDVGGPGTLSKGERIEAKVIQVEKDRVFVDLGTKAEGVVPLNELTEANVDSAVGLFSVGDTFDVVVLRSSGGEGQPIVSKRRADFDQAWHKIIEAFEEGKMFEAQVVDRVKGGLVVDIGVRGFVPATHVGSGKLRNIEKYVGQTLPVKIIEIDRERRKVVLSNRAAESERREEAKSDIFGKVNPGDVLEGTVRRLTDYGAFVDLGGIDGLLHISEMSWIRIDHPKEVISEGDDIKVMVLRLDEANGRVSLGLRQVLPDPWNLIRENYKLGQKLNVKVSRMVQSGAFVRLPEGAEAFLPLSEISNKRLKRPQDELEEGQDIEPIILDLRPDERRMVLSMREGAVPGQSPQYGRYDDGTRGHGGRGGGSRGGGRPGGPPRRRPDGDFEQAQPTRTAPTGGATIGERLGMLKGILKPDADAASEPSETPAETKEEKSGE